MYKCTEEKGKMTFTKGKKSYTPGGIHTDLKDLIKEYDLVKEISLDHGWSFPVVECLNRRKQALLENLMKITKESLDGRSI